MRRTKRRNRCYQSKSAIASAVPRVHSPTLVAEVGDLAVAAEAGATTKSSAAEADCGEEHARAAGLAHLVVALLVAE